MSTEVFQRHEIKYLLNPMQRAFLCKALEEYMVPDPHGESTICNVYYDTPDYRLIRRSLEKPVYKEKIRIRSYGACQPEDSIFLELKKKYDGVVYKRRIEIKEKDAVSFLQGTAPLPADSQIAREIQYFCQFYGPLEPAVHLCYDRCAYYSKTDPDLRITFDQNIRWEKTHLSLTDLPKGKDLLEPKQSLLEIKTASALPLWLTRALSEAKIHPVSFSKYGTVYQTGLYPHPVSIPKHYPVESRGYIYV